MGRLEGGTGTTLCGTAAVRKSVGLLRIRFYGSLDKVGYNLKITFACKEPSLEAYLTSYPFDLEIEKKIVI